MPSYRLFFIGRSDHIVNADVVECASDEEALMAACTKRGEHRAVEIWELARMVGRIDAMPPAD